MSAHSVAVSIGMLDRPLKKIEKLASEALNFRILLGSPWSQRDTEKPTQLANRLIYRILTDRILLLRGSNLCGCLIVNLVGDKPVNMSQASPLRALLTMVARSRCLESFFLF